MIIVKALQSVFLGELQRVLGIVAAHNLSARIRFAAKANRTL